jgi:hypothetical protein
VCFCVNDNTDRSTRGRMHGKNMDNKRFYPFVNRNDKTYKPLNNKHFKPLNYENKNQKLFAAG